jgi:hypothetical protein
MSQSIHLHCKEGTGIIWPGYGKTTMGANVTVMNLI